jgi:tRNA dimethylallyltransferase
MIATFERKTIKQLIVIGGPTASGKTALAVELARYFSTIVISADSRQFYKELSIGTAKPTEEEMSGIQHFFIGSHSIHLEMTAATYAKEAGDILDQQFKLHDTVILVGGSGMFIDALCNGLDDIPASKELRDQINTEFEEKGLDALLNELKASDSVYYEHVDKKNPVRIIRALEAIRLSGKPYSELRKAHKKELPFSIHRFVIDHPREQLYDRINRRVDMMMESGLLEEVRPLLPFRDLTALRTVGYSELFDYLEGKTSVEVAIELIKQNSRRYAKRQLTWFRRDPSIHWIPFDSVGKMKEEIVNLLPIS